MSDRTKIESLITLESEKLLRTYAYLLSGTQIGDQLEKVTCELLRRLKLADLAEGRIT